MRGCGTALLLLALVGCRDLGGGGRYRAVVDPASRYGFRHVQDRETRLWVHREVEVRVSERRRLPDPLSDTAHGDRLHSSRFAPGSVGTGNLVPERFERTDGFRVWRYRETLGEDDLAGRTALGVQVEWPNPGAPSTWEPMEIFALPPPGSAPPETWSAWMPATAQREGGFGWWEEVHGTPEAAPAPVAHPFELRWRLLLRDRLWVE